MCFVWPIMVEKIQQCVLIMVSTRMAFLHYKNNVVNIAI